MGRSKYEEPRTSATEQKQTFTDVEDVYKYIGRFGLSQVLYVNLLSVLNTSAAFNFLSGVFLLVSPEWECVEGTTCTRDSDICELKEMEWMFVNMDATMIGYFGLQCRKSYATLASSLFFIPGTVVGLAASGYASDRFGRKKTVLISLILTLLISIGQAVTSNFVLFLVFRSLLGMTCAGYQGVYNTYRNEFFDNTTRSVSAFIGTVYKNIGLLLLPLISYLFPWWRALHITNCVLVTLCFVVVFVPETPQWLIKNSTLDETSKVLVRMSLLNRKPIEASQVQIETDKVINIQNGSGNVLVIFRDKFHLLLTLSFFYQWFITSLMFYGFYFGLESISGSVYANFAIMEILEIPFNILTSVLMNVAGRKKSFLLSLTVIIVCSIMTFIPLNFTDSWNLKRVATIVASKWGTSSCFLIIYLYTNEVMPTSIRSTGLHLCSISGRIGSFIAPFVVDASIKLASYVQNTIFIAISLIGIVLILMVPETKNVAFKATEFANKNDEKEDVDNLSLQGV